MDRNWRTVQLVLDILEDLPAHSGPEEITAAIIEDQSERAYIARHVLLLVESEYFKTNPLRLTWKGHELLAILNNPTISSAIDAYEDGYTEELPECGLQTIVADVLNTQLHERRAL